MLVNMPSTRVSLNQSRIYNAYASLKALQSGRFRQTGDYYLFMSIYFPLELYWTAPEFLGEDAIVRCSQAGDSYSYGIILNELLSREEPYSSLCMDPRGG